MLPLFVCGLAQVLMKTLGIRSRILIAVLGPAILVAVLVTGLLVIEQMQQGEAEQHRRLAAVARQRSRRSRCTTKRWPMRSRREPYPPSRCSSPSSSRSPSLAA